MGGGGMHTTIGCSFGGQELKINNVDNTKVLLKTLEFMAYENLENNAPIQTDKDLATVRFFSLLWAFTPDFCREFE